MLTERDRAASPGPGTYTALTGVYTIDPAHTTVGFSVRHAMISTIRGRFDRIEGLLLLDGSDPSRSTAYVSLQTDSIDTGTQERDVHLRGPEFFDSATYPLMAFRSTRIVQRGDDEFRLTGSLRIKDIELPLDIDLVFGGAADDVDGQRRVGFEGTATLRRSDWGLTWNTTLEAGGVLVSDKVTLALDISAVRIDPDAAA
ncbi:YceI family protein [Streptomyces canus]|uniref:YceI family protein n=1 Tax=Streptomyces canus TaxID=58343 RepID=UPI00074919D2|nr:YceI family protein [Streptomyces canus]KUN01877.1 polyisoprenoid-binding protein [Streptomyces canus]